MSAAAAVGVVVATVSAAGTAAVAVVEGRRFGREAHHHRRDAPGAVARTALVAGRALGAREEREELAAAAIDHHLEVEMLVLGRGRSAEGEREEGEGPDHDGFWGRKRERGEGGGYEVSVGVMDEIFDLLSMALGDLRARGGGFEICAGMWCCHGGATSGRR